MKKIYLIMIAAILAIALSVPAAGEVVDRIVAIVNDDVITLSELNENFDPYQKKIEASLTGQEKERMILRQNTFIMLRH